MTNLDSVIKKQRHHFAGKSPCSQSYDFSSSHVRMWELDHKEGWAPKNWCFQIVLLEKTLESPLSCKVIKTVNPKGNQPWILIGRTDTEAPILWPPDVKSWLIGKDPEAGKDWGQKEKEVGRGLDSIIDLMDMNLTKLLEIAEDRVWRAVVHGVTKNQTWLRDWTTTNHHL